MSRHAPRTARHRAPVAALALLVTLAGSLSAQAERTYRVHDLAPGVFAAMGPPGVPAYLFANSLVVEGEDGVLVVDSGQRPGLARELIALIRERTDAPVRWVVNTHWHGDHVWGNGSFRDAFPGARLLATPATRDSVAAASGRQVEEQIAQQRAARERLAAMIDTADAALGARIRAEDSVRLSRIEELERLRIVEPTALITERTELDLGGRTAVLLPMGPAHTPGDLAVWLPGDRILAVGDLLEEGELWLEGADVVGWRRALDALAALEPRVVVPVHGGVSEDGALLAAGRAQLREAYPRPADIASPEAIVTAAYESLSRPPGEPFQWERFASLFAPGALLVPNTEQTGGAFRIMTVAEFTAWVDGYYAENAPIGGPDDHGFAEEEIHSAMRRYGDVVQVMSTYQKRLWDSDEILGRGVNAMTLVHDGGRWWILSVAWDEENGAGPIPPGLLP